MLYVKFSRLFPLLHALRPNTLSTLRQPRWSELSQGGLKQKGAMKDIE